MVARPATKVSAAAPTANGTFQSVSKRPARLAAVPSAVSAMTSPTKKAPVSATPPRRLCAVVACVCDPMYETIPTPAGSVQGHVLVEKMPPAMATITATMGYAATDAERLSMKSAGFMRISSLQVS